MDPALRAQIGQFVPEASRNFFYIASHLEPLALFTHFYHWWDLAQMRDEPEPILSLTPQIMSQLIVTPQTD